MSRRERETEKGKSLWEKSLHRKPTRKFETDRESRGKLSPSSREGKESEKDEAEREYLLAKIEMGERMMRDTRLMVSCVCIKRQINLLDIPCRT